MREKSLPSDRKQRGLRGAEILSIWCRAAVFGDLTESAGQLELMTEAFLEEKDTEDLVVRKGWGCESCI